MYITRFLLFFETEKKLSLYLKKKKIILEFIENTFCVLVLIPLKQRAHSLSPARDLLFLDFISACDPNKHYFIFFLTLCAASVLLLGVLVVSEQITEAYSESFHIMNLICVLFRNRSYTKTVDNSAAEIVAIEKHGLTPPILLSVYFTFFRLFGINYDDCIIEQFQSYFEF